jgi:[ribosomal protein S18]-alanine N-acetyltransferase
MIEIVAADAQEIAAIMPIMQSAFDPAFGEAWTAAQCMALLAMPQSKLLLARRNCVLAGFAISRWVLDEEELMMIGVNPQFQRHGIATRLLQQIICEAKHAHRRQIFLEVRANNSAKSFYEALGFFAIGQRKDYYRSENGAMIDAVTMTLGISDQLTNSHRIPKKLTDK